MINLHSSFEQLVQIVCPLHELESDADKEKLLKLLHCKPDSSKTDDEGCHETAHWDDDVEVIPPIGKEARPPQTNKAHKHVEDINECDAQEELVYDKDKLVLGESGYGNW